MTWALFLAVAAVIVIAGGRLARDGDVLGEKTGMGRSWIGAVLLAATTSLPELFSGFGATALAPLPDIAVGDVLGSCMFNLLILSMMDAVQPDSISARAHQGHALSIGFGLLLIGVAGLGLAGGPRLPALAGVGVATPLLIVLYLVAVRTTFRYEVRRRAREAREVAEDLHYADIPLRVAALRYVAVAIVVVAAAVWLPRLGAALAEETGLGQAFVGTVLIAVATSLPEVAVSMAAVRMGAIDLGIGTVLGSNLFNVFILGLDDMFYRDGSLLAAVGPGHGVSILAVVVMNALFLVGLTFQVLTKRFPIAWDTGAIAVVYACAMWLMYLLQ